MNVENLLTKRFTAAIKKSFAQCPLIGPKWFRHHASGRPAHFQFTGVEKLAKATSGQPQWVAKRILRNLDTTGLNVEILVTQDCKINVTLKSPPAGDAPRLKAPAGKPAAKKKSARAKPLSGKRTGGK